MINYFVGLLNSNLVRWVYRNLTQEQNRVFAEVKPVNLRKLPIRLGDFSKPEHKKLYQKIVELVEDCSNSKLQLYTPNSTEYNSIDELVAELNSLIYKLYGLTSEEIAIIEAKG